MPRNARNEVNHHMDPYIARLIARAQSQSQPQQCESLERTNVLQWDAARRPVARQEPRRVSCTLQKEVSAIAGTTKYSSRDRTFFLVKQVLDPDQQLLLTYNLYKMRRRAEIDAAIAAERGVR